MTEDTPERADSRLRESEARYQAVIENASDMIQSVRPDGTFEFVNAAWHKILGYSAADLDGMNIWQIIHPDELQHCIALFTRAIAGEPLENVRTTFVAKDGRSVPVEGSASTRFLDGQPIATHAFFRDISEQLRLEELRLRNEQLERERSARFLEKMAALGKLASGLAHELNNPASAARRASSGLLARIERRDDATEDLVRKGLPLDAWQQVMRIAAAQQVNPPAYGTENPLETSRREEEIETWLDDHAIAHAWRIAPDLVAAGVTVVALDELQASVPAQALEPAICWLTESLAVRAEVDVIARSAGRLSEIVAAVKAYSYMDRAAEQLVDIHDGIDNTRIILAHQLKNMAVTLEYDRSLPPVRTFGSGLNQVWTNIIDNAVDATAGSGALTIRTRRDGNNAVVEISDNGPGIPEEIQSRIFDPFFTTKPQGSGTGLGLDTVWRIVTEEHQGTVALESRPGCTVFRVTLPIVERA